MAEETYMKDIAYSWIFQKALQVIYQKWTSFGVYFIIAYHTQPRQYQNKC